MARSPPIGPCWKWTSALNSHTTYVLGANESQIYRLLTADLVPDPTRAVFYASVPSGSANAENQILTLDPLTGQVLTSISATNPTALAVSDNGQYLYAAVEGGRGVQRFQLPATTQDGAAFTFDATGTNLYLTGYYFDHWVTTPEGFTNVSRHEGLHLGANLVLAGNRLFSDSAVLLDITGPRALGTFPVTGSKAPDLANERVYVLAGADTNRVVQLRVTNLGPGDARDLLVEAQASSGVGFVEAVSDSGGSCEIAPSQLRCRQTLLGAGATARFTVRVDASAASRVWYFGGQVEGVTDIHLAQDRVFTDNGRVFGPDLTLLHQFEVYSYDVVTLPDPASGLIFRLQNGITAYRWSDYTEAGTQPTLGAWPYPSVVRWGSSGLAYLSGGQPFVVPSVVGLPADADGASNRAEFVAGTDPHEAASVLRLSGRTAGAAVELSWPTTAGRTYRLQRAGTLAGATWTDVDSRTGDGAKASYTVPSAGASGAAYYRVLTALPR